MDYAATAPMLPESAQAMAPFLHEEFGNPSAVYAEGRRAKNAIDQARRTVAHSLGAAAREICFTSGGSEADNWAVIGAWLQDRRKNHVVTTKIEHHAVLRSCAFLESMGVRVTYLDTDEKGLIDEEQLRSAMCPETALVSIMTANNEIGTIEPVSRIGEIVHAGGALFHTDAVQAYGHIPLQLKDMPVDLLSISAHKIGGPKGVGALFIRQGLELPSFIHGGAQERGKRAGTENTAGIVGFAAAAQRFTADREEREGRLRRLRDELAGRILNGVKDVMITGPAIDSEQRLPGHLSLAFRNIPSELLLVRLDEAGIAASAGSACAAGSLEPSHVLQAVHVPQEYLQGALRLTLGEGTTRDDVEQTADVLIRTAASLSR